MSVATEQVPLRAAGAFLPGRAGQPVARPGSRRAGAHSATASPRPATAPARRVRAGRRHPLGRSRPAPPAD